MACHFDLEIASFFLGDVEVLPVLQGDFVIIPCVGENGVLFGDLIAEELRELKGAGMDQPHCR